ncbi:MAG TPA: oligopeptide/dipeptide ABC transporter ATP-binding protein [Acidimicrobiia bacterium]|nr:oligopeptide/dipeptide ABC transporter ATP-binding protein [Acidimicrobiia bacterium]
MTLPGQTTAVPAANTAPTIAEVRNLKVHFNTKAGIVHAVDGVDFSINDGETLGLVGETGCGKSVTARSFLRLVPMPPGIQVDGSIFFRPRRICPGCAGGGCVTCGFTGRVGAPCPSCSGTGCPACGQSGIEQVDLLTVPESRLRQIRGDRIAMIFQDPGKALNPSMSIRQQVGEVFLQHRTDDVLINAGLDPEHASSLEERHASLQSRAGEKAILALPPFRGKRNRINKAVDQMIVAALAETQIPNPLKVMDRYPHELSGGMKQRVMIAQALACNPDLLIADEPTTALDVTVQARIIELIRELQERTKTAVLYISHDLSLVRRVCDRVAVMYAGRIVEVAASDQLFTDPQHPYTRGLLAAIPSASHERGHLVAIEGTVPELVDPAPGCRFAGRCPHEAEVCTTLDPVLTNSETDHSVACFIHHPPAAPASSLPSFARIVR